MRTVVWIAVGAVGGIAIYRRVERALADARENGVVATVHDARDSATAAVAAARGAALSVSSLARRDGAPAGDLGSAAGAVVRQARRGE